MENESLVRMGVIVLFGGIAASLFITIFLSLGYYLIHKSFEIEPIKPIDEGPKAVEPKKGDPIIDLDFSSIKLTENGWKVDELTSDDKSKNEKNVVVSPIVYIHTEEIKT